jgi:hypothetical protein
MGFNLLAFAGGAAKGLSEEMDKAEEEAKTYALASTKTMHERYAKLVKDNRELVDSASADLDIIKANYVGNAAFSEQQMYQIGINPAVRAQLVKAVTDKDVDLSTLSASQIIKMTEGNIPGTAKDRIAQAYKIPSMVATKADDLKKTGFFEGFGDRAGKTAAQKYANVVGVPLEQMQGAMQEQVKPVGTAEFDLSSLKGKKTFAQMQDDAKIAYVNASKTGDEAGIKKAAGELAVFEATKTNLKQEQIDWAEQKAGLRFKLLKGDKEAGKQLDRMIAIEALEDKKKGGDGEGKVPSLGTLNSFARDAGSRAVDAVFGKKLGADLARTSMADGTLSLNYIGTDRAKLAEVEKVRADAVTSALSLFPDNRDVQAIKKSYVMPNMPADPTPAAPAKPTLPAPAAAPAKLNVGQERAIANDAIRQGANADQVKKRFKEATGQDL